MLLKNTDKAVIFASMNIKGYNSMSSEISRREGSNINLNIRLNHRL